MIVISKSSFLDKIVICTYKAQKIDRITSIQYKINNEKKKSIIVKLKFMQIVSIYNIS